jgi:hypothetical protein
MNYYWRPGGPRHARGSFRRRGALVTGAPPALRHARALGRSRGSWRRGPERESVARSARLLLVSLTASTRVRNCDARERSRSGSTIIIPSRPGATKAVSRRLVASRSRALLELEQSTGTPRGGAVRDRSIAPPGPRRGKISLRRRPLEGRRKRSYFSSAVAAHSVAGHSARPARHKNDVRQRDERPRRTRPWAASWAAAAMRAAWARAGLR